MQLNPGVDHYLLEGCGRCELGGTPACKVHTWREQLDILRIILLECGLTEEIKWSIPCYTFQDKNILILSAFKEYCSLGFFKGVLLKDSGNLLYKPGVNSQSSRQIRFTSLDEIIELKQTIILYVYEAIEVEKSGLKVPLKKTSEYDVPEEFARMLEENPKLNRAFKALTPGRQRGYLLYFSAPKQSKTRISRVEKYISKILEGKGFHDRYKI